MFIILYETQKQEIMKIIVFYKGFIVEAFLSDTLLLQAYLKCF